VRGPKIRDRGVVDRATIQAIGKVHLLRVTLLPLQPLGLLPRHCRLLLAAPVLLILAVPPIAQVDSVLHILLLAVENRVIFDD
jgi:hypothetical protein